MKIKYRNLILGATLFLSGTISSNIWEYLAATPNEQYEVIQEFQLTSPTGQNGTISVGTILELKDSARDELFFFKTGVIILKDDLDKYLKKIPEQKGTFSKYRYADQYPKSS